MRVLIYAFIRHVRQKDVRLTFPFALLFRFGFSLICPPLTGEWVRERARVRAPKTGTSLNWDRMEWEMVGCFSRVLYFVHPPKAHEHEQWIKCLICILVLLLQRLVFEINRIVCECVSHGIRRLFVLAAVASYHHHTRVLASNDENVRCVFNTCMLCLFETILTLNLSIGCLYVRVYEWECHREWCECEVWTFKKIQTSSSTLLKCDRYTKLLFLGFAADVAMCQTCRTMVVGCVRTMNVSRLSFHFVLVFFWKITFHIRKLRSQMFMHEVQLKLTNIHFANCIDNTKSNDLDFCDWFQCFFFTKCFQNER